MTNDKPQRNVDTEPEPEVAGTPAGDGIDSQVGEYISPGTLAAMAGEQVVFPIPEAEQNQNQED